MHHNNPLIQASNFIATLLRRGCRLLYWRRGWGEVPLSPPRPRLRHILRSTPPNGGSWRGAFHPERRLGCIGCPLQSDQGLQDFRDNPKMFRAWCRAVKQWWDTHPHVASRTKYFTTTTGIIAHNIFYRSYGKWQKADLEDDGSEVFARTHHRDWLTFLETEIGVNLKDIFPD